VLFEIFPQTPNDLRFQQVSGLSVNMATEDLNEGGENRFAHQLVSRPKYSHLVLKRGMFIGSGIISWCEDAIENFDIKPTNIFISLLNDMHLPVASWHVMNAYPVKWEISEFDAEKSAMVVETIELAYNYYKVIRI